MKWLQGSAMSGRAIAAAALVCIVVGLVMSTSAFAQSKYRKQLDELRSQVEQLAANDHADVVSKDLEQTEQMLEDAKVLLAEGSVEEASWRLTSAEEMIVLIEERLKLADLKDKANSREETIKEYKGETIPKLEKDIEDLKKQKEKLSSDVADQ